MIGSAVSFALYAVLSDYLRRKKKEQQEVDSSASVAQSDVTPQSNEMQSMGDDGKHQTVTFADSEPGYVDNSVAYADPSRSDTMLQDVSLENFMARPTKIATLSWGVGTNLSTRFNPWNLFFGDSRVINRIANYKLLHCNLHVKFLISGNGFHYGRALVSYNPLSGYDEMTINRAFVQQDAVGATQRPHVWLNPTSSEGAEMVLPFFYPKNQFDITISDWLEMGEIDIYSIQGLKHANGATDSVTVTVFAWAEDLKLAMPTAFDPSTISPQSDEYSDKPVSRVAGAVAKMAGALTNVPMIAPFATATQIGANAVGAIATLFGYSSPVKLEFENSRLIATPSLAVTNDMSDAQKLTLDCKQELSIDPKISGIDHGDELAIKYIAGKETFLRSFNWNVGTTEDALLFNAIVDPALHADFAGETHLTAPAFASLPFKYWRGSMKFRFMIVASNYHRGRLRIVYDPEGTSNSSEYNTAYTSVVDIAEEMDFTMTVGWGQDTSFREHMGLNGNTGHSATTLAYAAAGSAYGNGTISVYVVNELTVPNTTANNDIQINVFVSMCDDFELAVPTGQFINKLRLTTSAQLVEPASRELVEPQSDEMSPTKPEGGNLDHKMAANVSLQDATSLIHFGESIGSFRSLLKRYQLSEYFYVENADTGTYVYNFLRNRLPIFPGYYDGTPPTDTGGITPVSVSLASGNYVYSRLHLIQYLRVAYGGYRGGIRYKIDATGLMQGISNSSAMMMKVGRTDYITAPVNALAPVVGFAANDRRVLLERDAYTHDLDGAAIATPLVNPIMSVELPYFSRFRFCPGKLRDVLALEDSNIFEDQWCLQLLGTNRETHNPIPVYAAAAEDFTCFFYLGPPIFYEESAIPVT